MYAMLWLRPEVSQIPENYREKYVVIHYRTIFCLNF